MQWSPLANRTPQTTGRTLAPLFSVTPADHQHPDPAFLHHRSNDGTAFLPRLARSVVFRRQGSPSVASAAGEPSMPELGLKAHGQWVEWKELGLEIRNLVLGSALHWIPQGCILDVVPATCQALC